MMGGYAQCTLDVLFARYAASATMKFAYRSYGKIYAPILFGERRKIVFILVLFDCDRFSRTIL